MTKFDAPTETALAYSVQLAQALVDTFACSQENEPEAERHGGEYADCWHCYGSHVLTLLCEAAK